MPPNIVHSPSSLLAYMRCPQSRYWPLVGPATPAANEALRRGSSLHLALSQWGRFMAVPATREMPDVAMAEAAQSLIDCITAGMMPSAADEVRDTFLRAAERLSWPSGARYEIGLGITRTAAPVCPGPMPGDAADGTWLRGRIDRIVVDGDRLIITDYKSNRYIPNGCPDDVAFQVGCYAWLAQANHALFGLDAPASAIVGEAVYVCGPRTLTVDLSAPDLIVQKVRSVAADIETRPLGSDPWDAMPGEQCQYCPWIHECTAFKNLPAVAIQRPLVDADNARKATLLWAALKEATRRIETALKEYVNASGPVSVPDGTLDFRESTSYRLVGRPGVEALLAAGVTPEAIWERLDVTQTDALRLLKACGLRGDAAKDWLAAYGTPAITRRFQVRKGPDTDES